MAEPLYHLVPVDSWHKCKARGCAYYPPTFQQDSFIHLTKDATCLLPVANHFYKDTEGRYEVLKLDPAKLAYDVRFEPAAPVGNKDTTNFQGADGKQVELFPHLYGTINFKAVVAELTVKRSEDGTFEHIEGV